MLWAQLAANPRPSNLVDDLRKLINNPAFSDVPNAQLGGAISFAEEFTSNGGDCKGIPPKSSY